MEASNVDIGNLRWVHYKSSTFSQPRSHLGRPHFSDSQPKSPAVVPGKTGSSHVPAWPGIMWRWQSLSSLGVRAELPGTPKLLSEGHTLSKSGRVLFCSCDQRDLFISRLSRASPEVFGAWSVSNFRFWNICLC